MLDLLTPFSTVAFYNLEHGNPVVCRIQKHSSSSNFFCCTFIVPEYLQHTWHLLSGFIIKTIINERLVALLSGHFGFINGQIEICRVKIIGVFEDDIVGHSVWEHRMVFTSFCVLWLRTKRLGKDEHE